MKLFNQFVGPSIANRWAVSGYPAVGQSCQGPTLTLGLRATSSLPDGTSCPSTLGDNFINYIIQVPSTQWLHIRLETKSTMDMNLYNPDGAYLIPKTPIGVMMLSRVLVIAGFLVGSASAGSAQDFFGKDLMRQLGFTADIPGNPSGVPVSVKLAAGGRAFVTSWTSSVDGIAYNITVTEMPARYVAQYGRENLFKDSRDGLVSQAKATISSEKAITRQGRAGREYVMNSPGGDLKVRDYMSDSVFYRVFAVYNPSIAAPQIGAFFDSFQFIAGNTGNSPQPIVSPTISPAARTVTIATPQEVLGELTTSDSIGANGARVDHYVLEGYKGEIVSAIIHSDDFKPTLRFTHQHPDGKWHDMGDKETMELGAELTAGGTYHIYVSAADKKLGKYFLLLTSSRFPPQILRIGTPTTAPTLESPFLRETMLKDEQGSFYDGYVMKVQKGEKIRFTSESKAFSPRLVISMADPSTGDEKILAQSIEKHTSQRATLVVTAQHSGDLFIFVSSTQANQTGPYSLKYENVMGSPNTTINKPDASVSALANVVCIKGVATLYAIGSGFKGGTLASTAGKCATAGDTRPATYYTLNVRQKAGYMFDMQRTSGAYTARMQLYDASGKAVGEEMRGEAGDVTGAWDRFELEPRTYYLAVLSGNPKYGGGFKIAVYKD